MFTSWRVQDTLQLIEEMKTLPILWDATCEEYKDRSRKTACVTQLGEKYGVGPTEMEGKIQSLKSQFRREHKKVMKLKTTGTVSRKALWFGYEPLLYLLQGGAVSKGSWKPEDESSYELDYHIKQESAYELDHKQSQTSAGETDDEATMQDEAWHHGSESSVEIPASGGSSDYCNFKGVCNKRMEDSAVVTDPVAKRDEYAVYGEHVANRLRYCARSRYEIAKAQRLIDDVCYRLAVGELAKRAKREDPLGS